MSTVDLSYNAEDASRTLSMSNENATSSNEQLKAIKDKITGYLGRTGTAVSGDLGEFMSNSFESDLNPVFENLNASLNSLIDSVSSTNTTMENVQAETQALYK
ncbi:MAG: hypothetical protein K2H20_03555 [Bacilli bacterium]|nr:hypothetical protein [Bacilli bacterium]